MVKVPTYDTRELKVLYPIWEQTASLELGDTKKLRRIDSIPFPYIYRCMYASIYNAACVSSRRLFSHRRLRGIRFLFKNTLSESSRNMVRKTRAVSRRSIKTIRTVNY